MDAVDLRYSRAARARDVLVCVALAMILGSIVAPLLRRFIDDDVDITFVLAVYTGTLAPLVLVAGLWRWGRRGRVDSDGVEISLSARGPVLRLAWAEVDEFFGLGQQGFELRGNGLRVRVSSDFDGADRALARFKQHRAVALGESLVGAFLSGGTVRFRGPLEPAAAIAQGLIQVFVFMPVLLGPWLLMPGVRPSSGMGGLRLALIGVACVLGSMLLAFLHSKMRDCGWVEVGPDGLALRLAGFPRRHRWEEIESAEPDALGRLIVRTRSGGRVVVPASFANFPYVEPLLRLRIPRKEGA